METRKVCLLAGRTSAELVRGLTAYGYDLMVQTPSSPPLRTVLQAAALQNGARIEFFQTGLETAEDASRLFAQMETVYGRLSLFVKICETLPTRSFLEMDETSFHAGNNKSWRSSYFGVCEAGRAFAKQGEGGCIVLVTSNRYKLTHPGESLEGSISAALSKCTRYAALEFAKYNVRLVCLAPGSAEPENLPLKRNLSDTELAGWIHFAASPAAASLTGATIDLDGGECLVDQPLREYGL